MIKTAANKQDVNVNVHKWLNNVFVKVKQFACNLERSNLEVELNFNGYIYLQWISMTYID